MMYKENYQRIRRAAIRTVGEIFATSIAGGFSLHAQVDTNKLEQENQELRKRVVALEDLMKKEGIQPSTSAEIDTEPPPDEKKPADAKNNGGAQ